MCTFYRVGVKGPIQNQDNEFVLSPDILFELGPPAGEGADQIVATGSSLVPNAIVASDIRNSRMKLIKELTSRVQEQKLQEHGVELLWVKTKDLLDTSDVGQRLDVLMFYEAIVRGQVRFLLFI